MPDPARPREQRRAQRYPLQLPVRFCIAGETKWHDGRTDNISDSGVAIRTDDPVAPATSVVVIISLPPTETRPAGRLRAMGQVVRRSTSPSETPPTMMAVAIAQYRIDRDGKPLWTPGT